MAVGEVFTSYLEVLWDKNSLENLETNPTRNLLMSWKYIHHLVMDTQVSSVSGDEFSILLPETSCKITWKEFMTWKLNNSIMSHSYISNAGHRGQPKQDSNQNAQNLLNLKKRIKREMLTYSY